MRLDKEILKKWWKEIEAWKDGKQIQYIDADTPAWTDIDKPSFLEWAKYRVKPEPVLIPFDYSDAEFLIGKGIKRKNGATYVQLIHQVEDEYIFAGKGMIKFDYLFEHCIFLDGTPCGKPKV